MSVAFRRADLAAGMFVVALIAAGCGSADANDASSAAPSAEASASPRHEPTIRRPRKASQGRPRPGPPR